MSELTMEIGCPHGAWGMVVDCPHCGMPRHVSPSQSVTDRFLSEVERGEREWPDGAAASAGADPESLDFGDTTQAVSWHEPEDDPIEEVSTPDLDALRRVQNHLDALDYNRGQAFLLPAVDRENIYALVAPSYCDPDRFADCLDAFCVEARARADQILAYMASKSDGAQGGPPLDVERLARAMRVSLDVYGWDIDPMAEEIAAEYARLSVGEPRP